MRWSNGAAVRPATAAALIPVALAFAATGCPSEPPADDPRETSRPENGNVTADEEAGLVQSLRAVRDDIKRLRFAAEAQIANAASHADGLAKARRVFDGLHVAERIPSERDEESIRRTLRQAARKARLRLSGITITPQPRETRDLPAQVRPEEGFRYKPDDIREVLEVSLRAAPADLARIEALDRELAGAEPKRFVELRAVRAKPDGFDVVATAYRFVPVEPPRQVAELPGKEKLLEDPAIERLLHDLRSRPAVREQLEAIERELAEVQGLMPQVNRALEPIGPMELVVARTGVLERAAARVQDRSIARIMQ